MVTHLLLALVPAIVLASFTYSRFASIITNNTTQSLKIISEQTANSLESMIAQVTSVVDAVADQIFFQNFIHNSNVEAYYQDSNQFRDDLNHFITSTNYLMDGNIITSIHLYVDDSHYNVVSQHSNSPLFCPLSDTYGSYWHGIFRSTTHRTLVCPSMYLSPTELENDGDLAIIRKVSTYDGSEVYIAVYFSQSAVDSILMQDLPFTNSVIYINNQRESIVTTTNATLSGTYYLAHASIPESIPSTQKFQRLTFVDEAVYVGYQAIHGTDWYMVTAIPASNVVSESNILMIEFILIYLAFLIISIFVSLMLSNSIIKRLSNLIHQMKNVEQGPPECLEAPPSKDEIGDLLDTYNYMSNEINHLMEEQAKSAEELRLSEFRALQSQINPHFLYNTLDMINWKAQSGQSEEVSEAVQLLSRFYKLTLSKGNSVVLIRDELEQVSLYAKLQNMRYNNNVQFFVDVPDEMMDYKIPKLIFQPIVENAFLHGILEKEEKEGNIVIMGWMEEDALIFVISDDGVGMTPEKLNSILDGSGKSETGSNIGVYNTHRRLQLYYNDTECGLTYRSTPGVETEVEIRIPK